MTPIDASFTQDLGLIVYAIFVLGMLGLALSGLPATRRQNKSASDEYQPPNDSNQSSSQLNKAAVDTDDSNGTRSETDYHKHKPVSDYERRIVILTALIGFVTAFYAIVSIFQWNAMRTANALTQDQFRLSNRPWIGLVANSPVEIDKQFIRTDGTVEFVGKFNIQNYGTSVAVNTVTLGNGMSTDVEIACHHTFGGMEETCEAGRKFATGEILRTPPSHEKLGIVLFPNQTTTARLDLAADLGIKRPINVAITGCSVYIDQRKELHQTEFCVEAWFDGQRFEPWISCNICNEVH